MTEDEMVGWHHLLNGHECKQVPGVGDGQRNPCAVVHGVTKSWTRLKRLSSSNSSSCFESCLDCKEIKLVNPKGSQS